MLLFCLSKDYFVCLFIKGVCCLYIHQGFCCFFVRQRILLFGCSIKDSLVCLFHESNLFPSLHCVVCLFHRRNLLFVCTITVMCCLLAPKKESAGCCLRNPVLGLLVCFKKKQVVSRFICIYQ